MSKNKNLSELPFVDGIVKSTTSGFSGAVAGSDYQSPITLTTTGTSGVASFSAGVLNIPNYGDSIGAAGSAGTSGSSGSTGSSGSSGSAGTSGSSGSSGSTGTSGSSGSTGSSGTSGAGTISNGTSGYVSRFTGSTTLGNSLIRDDGTSVSIGAAPNNSYLADINGTGRFSGNLTVGNAAASTNVKLIFNGVASKAAGIEFHQSGSPQWYIGNGIASEDNNFELYNSNGTMAMKIIKSTNAINFIGAVGISVNSSSGAAMSIVNSGTGTSAYTGLSIGNTRSSNGGGVVLASTTLSTGNPIFSADSTYVYNNGSGGVGIGAEGATGSIKFGTAGILAMTIDSSQNVQMSSTGALTIPKGTTAQRPTASSGMIRFNTTAGLPEVYTGSDWIYMTGLNGSSAETAAPSASDIKAVNPAATDGVYWLKFASGSNTAFQAYIIFSKSDGPWVKALQWYGGTDLSGSAAVNAGSTWVTGGQINTAAGKIASADINILKSSLSTLWRVTGGSDNLMNNGSGTLKINWSYLPNWGTDAQPTTSQPYDVYLDMTSNGDYEYGYHYVPTQQGRCAHTTSIWVSDHDSPVGAGSGVLIATTPYNSYPICWTVGATGWWTNMHPWSGLSTSSAGSVQWGTGSNSSACSLFFKN